MRNKCFMMVALITILLASCSTTRNSMQKVDSDITDSEFINIYGNASHSLKKMSEKDFESVKKIMKRSVIEDYSLDAEEQEEKVSTINQLRYEEDRTYYFVIINKEPYLKKLVNLNFNMYNNENETLLKDVNSTSVKFTTFMDGLTFISYRYFWILISDVSILKDNFDQNELPIYVDVIYPDNKKEKYLILE